MGTRQEPEHLRGIVGPDEVEAGHYNLLRGSIPKPWAMGRGTAVILAGDLLALTAAACARPPDQPAEVSPAAKPIVEFKIAKTELGEAFGRVVVAEWEPAVGLDDQGKRQQLTSKHCEGAQVHKIPQKDTFTAHCKLTEQGKKLFTQISKLFTGRLLGVFVDGKLTATHRLKEENGEAVALGVVSDVEEQEAEQLVERLNKEAGLVEENVTTIERQKSKDIPEGWIEFKSKAGLPIKTYVPPWHHEVHPISDNFDMDYFTNMGTNLRIMPDPIFENGMTIDQYKKRAIETIREGSFRSISELKERQVRIAGVDGWLIEYQRSFPRPQEAVDGMALVFIRDGQGFTVGMDYDRPLAQQRARDFQVVIDNLEFTGPYVKKEPTPRSTVAPSPRPQPTEVPVSEEKKIIGDYRFTPVSIEELESQQAAYRRVVITLAVEYLKSGQLGSASGVIQNTEFKLQTAGGFVYPQGESGKGKFSYYNNFKIPPYLPLRFSTAIEVPKNISVSKDALLSVGGPGRPIQFDLRKFPSKDSAQGFTFPSSYQTPDGKRRELNRLGESLNEKSFLVTPLAAKMALQCHTPGLPEGSWVMGIKWKGTNNFGYQFVGSPNFFIADSDGNIWDKWSMAVPFTDGNVISPGLTQDYIFKGTVSKTVQCSRGGTIPPSPKDLKMVAWLEASASGYPSITSWGVYDIGTPPQDPPAFGKYVDAEKMFQAK